MTTRPSVADQPSPSNVEVLVVPRVVHILALTVLSMNTAEVMISGLVPALTDQFEVSVAAVGYLVSAYALGMAIGGPAMTLASLRLPRKTALIVLVTVFIAGQVLGALAPSYGVLIAARVITALAAGAFFGTGASVCVTLVGDHAKGRALSGMFGGLMVAQVVGLPMATLINQHWGWRASFWTVAALSVLCLAAITVWVPAMPAGTRVDLATELRAFRNRRLWVAYTTNALSVGAVFTTFSYLFPILTQLSGFTASLVPLLFAVYGTATIVGNLIVGRFADRHNVAILLMGQAALTAILVVFAIFAHNRTVTLFALVVLGLTGLPLSSARGARILTVSDNRPMITTVATAMINVGIVIGPWLGGLGINAGSLTAPMWIGAALAFTGLITVLPATLEARAARRRAPTFMIITERR